MFTQQNLPWMIATGLLILGIIFLITGGTVLGIILIVLGLLCGGGGMGLRSRPPRR